MLDACRDLTVLTERDLRSISQLFRQILVDRDIDILTSAIESVEDMYKAYLNEPTSDRLENIEFPSIEIVKETRRIGLAANQLLMVAYPIRASILQERSATIGGPGDLITLSEQMEKGLEKLQENERSLHPWVNSRFTGIIQVPMATGFQWFYKFDGDVAFVGRFYDQVNQKRESHLSQVYNDSYNNLLGGRITEVRRQWKELRDKYRS